MKLFEKISEVLDDLIDDDHGLGIALSFVYAVATVTVFGAIGVAAALIRLGLGSALIGIIVLALIAALIYGPTVVFTRVYRRWND